MRNDNETASVLSRPFSSCEKKYDKVSPLFNLILADIGLPGMSGLELCRFVAKKSPRTVVVMISGIADEQAVVEAKQAGAFDFITKPFDLDDVVATVERALQHQASQS